MKKFLALYRMDLAAMQKLMSESSAEDRKKSMAEWGAWMKKNTSSFADMGGPTGKNTQVSKSGATQMSNDIGGYSVIQAESVEAATALLKENPHFGLPGALIDLAEIMPMGM